MSTIYSRHGWLAALASHSATVRALVASLSLPDLPYWDAARKVALNLEAFNLANCDEHTLALARGFDGLEARGAPVAALGKLLTDLTARNTYGAFSELAAYIWFLDRGVPFDIQIPRSGSQILNPNGSDIDGCLTIGLPVLFDVKAFGFQEYQAEQLRLKLSNDFPSDFVVVSGSLDVPVSVLSDLLGKGYSDLKVELGESRKASRSTIDFELRPSARVQISQRETSPYALAEKNASYAFNYAKQFARNEPFILVFILHPWFNGSLTNNVGGYVDTFTRSFARRTFMQFKNDPTATIGAVTRGEASRLLSGVAFIDAWLGKPRDAQSASEFRLFRNPNALHSISTLTRHGLAFDEPIADDGFEYDNY